MRKNAEHSRFRSWTLLLVGDGLALLAFAVVGQIEHNSFNPADPLVGLAPTILPLWIAWAAICLLLGVGPAGRYDSGVRWMTDSLVAWLAASPLALTMRALWLGRATIATDFLISGVGFGGLFLLSRRLVHLMLSRRRLNGSKPANSELEEAITEGSRKTPLQLRKGKR